MVVNMYAHAGVKLILFSCGAAVQRGPWPPHSEVSRSHKTTHYRQQYSSRRVISSSQRPLPHNTQNSQETNIHATGEIRTHIPSKEAASPTT